MKDEDEKPIRGYYRMSKAWYAEYLKPIEPVTIMIGMYYPSGGCAGEMAVTWEPLDNQLFPQLKAFDDAWKLLVSCSDLLKEMAKWENENITEEQFADLLNSVGFTDLTLYKQNLKHRIQPRNIKDGGGKKLKR